MHWKKYMAVFLAAGIVFTAAYAGSPAAAFASEASVTYEAGVTYEVDGSDAGSVDTNLTSASQGSAASNETGKASADSLTVGTGEDGSGAGTTPAEGTDMPGGDASGSGTGGDGSEMGTIPAEGSDLPGGDAVDSGTGGDGSEMGTTPAEGTDLPGSEQIGDDSGETGDGTGTTPAEGGLLPWEDNVSADPGTEGDEEGTTLTDDAVQPGSGDGQSGTIQPGSGDNQGTGLPATVLPGPDTIGAAQDAMNREPGIMEQIEAAQRIITGKNTGYVRSYGSSTDTGSTHIVRSGSGSYYANTILPVVGEVVPSPVLKKEFRFWTVAKEAAIAKKKLPIREEMKSNSRTIGILPEDAVCYILKEEDGGWIYVESGTVRGFVRKELLISGLKATMMVETREFAANVLGNMTGQTFTEEEILGVAEEKVPALENAALTFRRATVYQTVVDKDPALAAQDVAIRESQSDDAREIGTLKAGSICYVIADKDQEWIYVESGDVRGFVKATDLLLSDTKINEEGKTLKDQIEENGESTYSLATELISADENEALYYSLMSTRSGVPGSSKREAVLSYAAQFIGNPYVWGGTDLVNGADCSGFVQSIYKQFGYTLPRTAAQQAISGEKIPVSEALPGDLIFYGNASGIYHVVMCAGGENTIEAKGSKYGIVSSTLNKKAAVWAIRVMDDADALEYEIPEELGMVHSYMGWQKVTNTRSQQYAFREAAGMTFDKEGFAVVDNRYVIACTDTFGAIGDYVDFYQEDGTKIPCIIGDFKNEHDVGCNKWGHMNGQCIIEFVVDKNSWYPTNHANPGTASCHPEWHQYLVKAERVGSFYE